MSTWKLRLQCYLEIESLQLVKMRSFWIRVVSNPASGILLRRENRDTVDPYTEGRRPHNDGAETGAIQLQATEGHRCQELPEAGETQGRSLLDFQRECGLLAPWLQASGVQKCERTHSCCFKPCSCGVSCSRPRKLILGKMRKEASRPTCGVGSVPIYGWEFDWQTKLTVDSF